MKPRDKAVSKADVMKRERMIAGFARKLLGAILLAFVAWLWAWLWVTEGLVH